MEMQGLGSRNLGWVQIDDGCGSRLEQQGVLRAQYVMQLLVQMYGLGISRGGSPA